MIKNKIVNVKGPKKPGRELSNLLIGTFLSVFFASGLDFGFSKVLKKNVQFLASYFCCLLSIFIITSISMQIVYKIGIGQIGISPWIIHGLIQYGFHAIFLRFSKYNLYNLIVDVHSVDTNIKRNKNKDTFIVNFFVIYFWISYALKSTFCYVFCIHKIECHTLYIPGHVYCILIMGMDVITLVQTLIYYYIYKAAKHLKVSLEDKDTGKDIKRARKQFTAIANICDKISPTYGRLVIVQILSNLPRALETMWTTLYFIKSGATFDRILSRIMVTIHLVFQLFVPSVFVEMASAQSEVLKSILYNRLVHKNDNKEMEEIVRFLRYIEDRPLHRKVWRIIPVDAKLITSLISLCTTYFIVIIQFSHLYD